MFGTRYRVEERLPGGGMGVLYRVTHVTTERARALKLLTPSLAEDPEARSRFRREAQVAARIESEHVVDVIDAGFDDEHQTPFIVMELLDGVDLEALLETEGPLPAATVISWLGQVASALERAHAAGIVHRDLKPANLFVVTGDDGQRRIKLLDFGIARLAGGTQHTQTILGTPMFMAPEQIRFKHGTVSARTDVYALTQIAYAMLVGEPYWAAEDEAADNVMQLLMEEALGVMEGASSRARRRRQVELPAGFDEWFAEGTARAPEERTASAPLAIANLAGVLGQEAPTFLEADRAQTATTGRIPRGGARVVPWGAAALLCAAVGGAWYLRPESGHTDASSPPTSDVEAPLATATPSMAPEPPPLAVSSVASSPASRPLAPPSTAPPSPAPPARPVAVPRPVATQVARPRAQPAPSSGYEPPLTER